MLSSEITDGRVEAVESLPSPEIALPAAQEIAVTAIPDDGQEAAAAAVAAVEPLDEVLEAAELEPVDEGPKEPATAPTDRPRPMRTRAAELTGTVLMPAATMPPENNTPPSKTDTPAEVTEEVPVAPAQDAGGGNGRPPTGPEIRTGGNDDDEGSDEPDDEPTTEVAAETREVSAEQRAEWEVKAAKARHVEDATAELLRIEPDLQHAEPTFRVVDPEAEEPQVILAYNQAGFRDENQQEVPPGRVVLPLDDPRQATRTADLPSGSPWIGGGEQPTEEHELTTSEIVKEMAAVTPEPEAVIFQDPQFAEALTAPSPQEVQVAVPMDDMRPATVDVLGRVPLREFRSDAPKTLLDVRMETEGGGAPQRTSLIERPDNPAYVAAWSALNEVGVPTTPELYTSPGDKLLTSDLMGDGSGLYGKTLHLAMASEHLGPELGGGRDRPRPEADEHFLRIMDNDFGAIKEQARHYAEVASHNQLVFAADDPLELRVRPNGEWQLVASGLEKTRIEVAGTTGSLIMQNTAALNKFYESLEGVVRRLRPAE